MRKPEGERWDLIIDGEDLIAMSADLDFKFLDFVFFLVTVVLHLF